MMRVFSMLSLMLLLAKQAHAQATVRTGEHENFTRIAINIPIGTSWEVNSTPAGYAIELDGVSFQNLDGFFDIIPKDRIESAEISSDTYKLEISASCKCSYVAELWRPSWLIVDIRDDEELDDDLSIEILPTKVAISEHTATVASPSAANPLPLFFEEENATRAGIQKELGSQVAKNQGPANGEVFEDIIGQSLERALSQGLINFVDTNRQSAAVSDRDLSIELEGEFGLVGLNSETALEDSRGETAAEEPIPKALYCIKDTEIGIANWRGEGTFSEQIARHRSSLTDEFDIPNEQAIIALARTYLYYGFGREAKGVLQYENRKSGEIELLTTLSEIIDGENISDSSFAEQIDCSTNIVIWAFLSSNNSMQDIDLPIEHLVLSFKTLPHGLQTHLGPRFADALSRVGATEAARSALRRALDSEESSTETGIARSNIDIREGEYERAREALSDLVDDNQRITPEALLQYVDLQLRGEEKITDATLNLVQSMQFQFSNEPIAFDLAERHALALIGNGKIERALKTISNIEIEFPSEDIASLNNAIARSVLDNGENMDIVEYAFSSRIFKNDEDIKKEFYEELQSLGFEDRANEIVNHADSRSPPFLNSSLSVRSSEASIEPSHDVPFAPDAELVGDVSSPSNAPSEKLSEEQLSKAEQDQRDIIWRSLVDSEEQDLREAVERMLDQNGRSAEVGKIAGNVGQLVEESELLRGTVTTLLERLHVAEEL